MDFLEKYVVAHYYRDEAPLMIYRPGDGLRKTAYATNEELVKFLAKYQLKPGYFYVLVNAMGAFENWGWNTNKDGFRIRELLNSFKTFESGHVFSNHCFPAGTKVLMGDRSRKDIESVVVGDSVVTLDGVRRVTALMSRAYSGKGVSIKVRGIDSPLVSTADHKILVYRREQISCRHKYSKINDAITKSKSPHREHCREMRSLIGAPEWVSAEEIRNGDYVVLPRPRHGEESINPWFAELVGWVASEGYLGKKGSIQFSFSEKNNADIDRVVACLSALGAQPGIFVKEEYGTVQISACSKKLSERISEFVSGTFDKKTLSSKVLSWDRDSLLRMLGAYIDGDGSIAADGPGKGVLRIRSCSPGMLNILSDVIRSLGYHCVVNWDNDGGIMVSPTNGAKYRAKPSGCVTLVPSAASAVSVMSRKRINWDPKRDTIARSNLIGETYVLAVDSVTEIRLSETVFDFEVDGPHHFVANEVVVHNCNRDPAKARGTVPLAMWNPAMRRVELMLELPEKKNEDWLAEIERGDAVGVSMGTRCYDRCSWCNNLATNKHEYCDHIKHHLGEIDEDGSVSGQPGTICGMFNENCNFFDISKVRKPADKSAYQLAKIASAIELSEYDYVMGNPLAIVTGGDQYLEKAASELPPSVLSAEIVKEASKPKVASQKFADIIKRTPMAFSGTSDLEDAFLRYQRDVLPALRDGEHEMSNDRIEKLLKDHKGLPNAMTALASNGVAVTPIEFQSAALIHDDLRPVADRLRDSGVSFEHCEPDADAGLDLPEEAELHDAHDLVAKKSYLTGPMLARLIHAGEHGVAKKAGTQAPEPGSVDELALRKVASMWRDYVKQASAIALCSMEIASRSPSVNKYAHNLASMAFGVDPLKAARAFEKSAPQGLERSVKLATAIDCDQMTIPMLETFLLSEAGCVKTAAENEPGALSRAVWGKAAGEPISDKAKMLLVAAASSAGALGGGYAGYKLSPKLGVNPILGGAVAATGGGVLANLAMIGLADQLEKRDKAEGWVDHLQNPPMVIGIPKA